ncbi:MAG: tRNA glutamyl-Q(34) synthetase GluQRS [Oscillospiraceae bacterium]|nr:tRNA glutamyl-Q(34) synthetase GluQRS [Oscillospiraceae bacterium]
MDEQKVVGRFAPSPSGRMHLGNACSCLLAWLSARSKGGEIILRLEDLDPERCKREYSQQLEEDLRWLGLDWDRGGPEDAPEFQQSNCGAFYEEALHTLEGQGLLYPCFCTRGELHAASAPHRSDGGFLYAGTCRNLTEEQRRERAKLRRPALRIRVPNQVISFTDGNLGPYAENLAEHCGDYIVRRSDGIHAYQLAVVVDDGRMGVTEVVRGSDLLDSTPRQICLQQQLGLPTPRYYHLPLLLAPDGRRLSKRDRDLDLGRLGRRMSPEELIGRLAALIGLLERPRPVRPAELLPEFSWERVSKRDVVVDGDFFG